MTIPKRLNTLWRNRMAEAQKRIVDYYTAGLGDPPAKDLLFSFFLESYTSGYNAGKKATVKTTEIRVEPRHFQCMDCKARFRREILLNVPVDTWCAHIKSLHCPLCGADYGHITFDVAAKDRDTP